MISHAALRQLERLRLHPFYQRLNDTRPSPKPLPATGCFVLQSTGNACARSAALLQTTSVSTLLQRLLLGSKLPGSQRSV